MPAKKRAQFEIIIICTVLLAVAFLSHYYDWFERIEHYVVKYEYLEIDEFLIVLFAAGLGSLIFSYRRVKDLKREAKERERVQRELASSNEKLDETVQKRTEELRHTVETLEHAMLDKERAWEQLQKTDRRYQDMFMNMTQGVGLVDGNEVVQFCNPAYAQIFEVDSANALIGTNLSHYLTPEAFEQAKAKTRDRKQGDSSSYEIDIITAKGNRKPILVSAAPKFDKDDKFIGTFGTITDLTELKRFQELSQRAERLDEAGRVAGQIAHDFNNLLSPIVAYPELIRRKLQSDHPVMQYVDAIEYAARQISDINQDLLTLGRRGHYMTKLLNLNAVSEQILGQFRHSHKHISFSAELDPAVNQITGGQSQITRTIVNLISNAIDAMPAGGTITVRTKNVTVTELNGAFGTIPDGDYACYTVADTGMGIPPEVLPKIMNPFFSTKKANDKSGSGLGLSVVYSVIKDHNGYIDVESKLGMGTQFHLYFPPSHEHAEADTTRPVIRGIERVLVVDDDPIQREVITTLLRSLGYTVTSVTGSLDALEFMDMNEVDLVMMDTVLPGESDGLETFRKIRAIHPCQKGILISGTVAEIPTDKANLVGLTKFLRKPVDLSTLSLAVREVLDGAPAEQHQHTPA